MCTRGGIEGGFPGPHRVSRAPYLSGLSMLDMCNCLCRVRLPLSVSAVFSADGTRSIPKSTPPTARPSPIEQASNTQQFIQCDTSPLPPPSFVSRSRHSPDVRRLDERRAFLCVSQRRGAGEALRSVGHGQDGVLRGREGKPASLRGKKVILTIAMKPRPWLSLVVA